MTTLSTHDTKHGEDVRARLDVLSELPEVWAAFLANVRPNDAIELLVWQAIVGAWPARPRTRLTSRRRRRSGLDHELERRRRGGENRLLEVVDRAFDDPTTRTLVEGMVATVRGPGWSNSLTAKLVQLTAPGVPDVYQGSELWEMSLVDPDNRRPGRFRRRHLALRRPQCPWRGAAADRRDRPGEVAGDDTCAPRPPRPARTLPAVLRTRRPRPGGRSPGRARPAEER